MAHRYGLLAAQPGGRLGGRPPDSVKGLHTLMDTLPASAVAAALLFAGTNIDDIVVLAVLNASSRASGQPKRWHIWAGQYAGITALAVVSLAAGRGLALIPAHWLWLLG